MYEKKGKEKSINEALSLTKQQKFNFESNEFEDEKIAAKKAYKKREEIIKVKKQLLRLEKQKNRYKSNFFFVTFISFILLFLCIFIFILRPRTVSKIVEKRIVDENIVFVGDSITWMYDLKKYYPNRNVINSGVDGEFTYGVLDDMTNRIYRYNPSKVFILIGTNDIYKGRTIEQITDNVNKIVKGIKKNRPYCDIYLESIYPVNTTDSEKIHMDMVKNRTNKFIQKINKEYKKIAKKNNITYIDMYSKLLDKDGNLNINYTKEGLHLVDDGYKIVTKEILSYLND